MIALSKTSLSQRARVRVADVWFHQVPLAIIDPYLALLVLVAM